MDFNCVYEHSSFAGASGACPAPGRGKAPSTFLDPAPGKVFRPWGLPRTPEFLAYITFFVNIVT